MERENEREKNKNEEGTKRKESGCLMEKQEYREYLEKVRRASPNTILAYLGDLEEFDAFLRQNGGGTADKAGNTDVVSYLLHLREKGKSAATINRKLASIRVYYRFLSEIGRIDEDPSAGVRSLRAEKKEIEYLTIEEVDRLLGIPDDSVKGKRDRAILEVLYATGIRVSELASVRIQDVNLRMGFISCLGPHSKARIIPLGRPARAALEEYLYDIRKLLVRGNQEEEALFVNYHGGQLTRQGIWKIIREYAEKAQIGIRITPQTLRNSFAVHMVQNGADLKSLQELLGHEDISATQIYLTVTKNRIKEVYDRTHPRA